MASLPSREKLQYVVADARRIRDDMESEYNIQKREENWRQAHENVATVLAEAMAVAATGESGLILPLNQSNPVAVCMLTILREQGHCAQFVSKGDGLLLSFEPPAPSPMSSPRSTSDDDDFGAECPRSELPRISRKCLIM